jgi:RimJ/RimL family protein N-acetyltransferase
MTAMRAIETPRLILVPLSIETATAMVNGHRPNGVNWARDYPTDSTLVAAGLVLAAEAEGHALTPWGPYQIVVREDGRVVGGCGFVMGGPDLRGHVQIGFSIADSERGEGYATEAVEALIAFAKAQPGVTRVLADTARTNAATIGVFEAAGMRRAGADGELVFFEA